MGALFVAGTDTGVGKTRVSALLAAQAQAAGLSVAYYKPVQTGVPAGLPPEDPDYINHALPGKVDTYCRYCFEPPVAPAAADPDGMISLTQVAADIEAYQQRYDLVLVEGAGGLAVPVSPQALTLDWIETLNLPVFLVARSGLGTMNHTLLSIAALQARKIPVVGVLFNFYPAEPQKADIAIQTLLPTIRSHLPKGLPTWHLQDSIPPHTTNPIHWQTDLRYLDWIEILNHVTN